MGASPRRSLLLAAAVACALPWSAASAQSDDFARVVDALNPFLSIGYGLDTNVFRYDDDLGVSNRDDRFIMASAGMDANIERGLQRVELNGTVTHTAFDEYDELDYTGARANAIWHWRTGPVTNGTAGYRFRRSMRDFANQASLTKRRDVRNEHQAVASLQTDVAANWRVAVRGSFADVTFDETDTLDVQRSTVGGRVSYVSGAGNAIGLDAQFLQASYDVNPLSDFDEYTVGPTLEWQYSPQTRLDARVGYTSRTHDDPLREDYDDVTGRATVTYTGLARTRFKADVYRDLSNLGDEVADYALVHGVSFEPSWQLSQGVDLRALVGYEKREFKVSAIDFPDRDDDVYTGAFYVDWQFHRNVKLSAGFDAQRRTSDRAFQDYDFGRLQLQIVGSL
jgi:hypothetical protein